MDQLDRVHTVRNDLLAAGAALEDVLNGARSNPDAALADVAERLGWAQIGLAQLLADRARDQLPRYRRVS